MKRIIGIAVLAVLAAGCSTPPPPAAQAEYIPPQPPGLVGPAGFTGPSGPAGPTGPAGPVGAQGLAGQTGAQGSTLVGPTGPAGSAGGAGTQGISGQAGARGSVMAGGIGGAGHSGAQGAQGVVGPTGPQGPVGIVNSWTSYRVITFDNGRADLSAFDKNTVSEIAAYMAKNPSLQVGLDGYKDPSYQNLSDRRVGTVRDALIVAGVPSYKVQVGAFGDPQFSRDRRVEVLLSTGSSQVNQSMMSQ